MHRQRLQPGRRQRLERSALLTICGAICILWHLQDSDKKSVQFKLKGIFAEATGYRDIKSVLEQEHGLDVKFVSMAGGEARVRLVGGSDSASEVWKDNNSIIL